MGCEGDGDGEERIGEGAKLEWLSGCLPMMDKDRRGIMVWLRSCL